MLPYSCPSPFWSHLFVGTLLSACSSMHAPIRMLPSLDKYIIHYRIVRQIINPLFTIPCKLKKIECHIFLTVDCSSLHAPIYMLPSACSHTHASTLIKICSLLTVHNANNYSPFLPFDTNENLNVIIKY